MPPKKQEQVQELSIEEFEALTETKPEADVSQLEVLSMIQDKALSTAQIAKQLGKAHATTYSRLGRLLNKGLVQKRYKEAVAYWLVTDKGKDAIATGEIPEE